MNIQKKLIAAGHDMVNPVKDTSAYKYKYAQLDQVLQIVQRSLAKNGLGLRQQSQPDGAGGYQLATIVFDDDEQIILDIRSLLDSPDAQVKGSYETYMRRYALQTAFALAAEDDDGFATTQQGAQTPAKPKQASTQPIKPNASISGVTEPQGRYSRIASLKREALGLGIQEDGIRAWMASTIKDAQGAPKPMSAMSDAELAGVEKYLEQLINDLKGANHGSN